MGANFHVACHRCKERAFAFRDFESTGETLTKFFHKHYDCGKLNPRNVQVIWDYFEEPEWSHEDSDYKNISEDVSESYKRTVANDETRKTP